MHRITRTLLTVSALVAVGALPLLLMPGLLPCASANAFGFERLSDSILVDSSLSKEEAKSLQSLVAESRARLVELFGEAKAEPLVIFFDESNFGSLFRLNSTASTAFFPGQACLLIGPKGQSVDVVAHELVHAEIFARIGFLDKWLKVPVWFDEGIAMQVDYRPRFELVAAGVKEGETMFVTRLVKAKDFFSADNEISAQNYAAAKAEVGQWLRKIGPREFYRQLELLDNGESFSEFYGPEG